MIGEQPTTTVAERRKPSTAHIKVVPETREMRDRVRDAAKVLAAKLDRSRGFNRDELRTLAEALLADMGLGSQYSGFAAVCIANEFWREQVQAIPFNRRLLLLPHCLKHAEGCPADYDEFGLDCRKCGACSVADFKTKAEDLGYKVLVSEGTPIVLKIIVSGHVDAIVGVACLNVLERAFDKILLAGVPCVATPLLSSNCKSTSVDEDWVMDMIQLETPPAPVKTRSFMPLLRAAHSLCEQPELSRLAPGPRADLPGTDPLRAHEDIAYSWMATGGKRSRPFITLAAYDAMLGGAGTRGGELAIPDPVKRAALAIEAFHKASLIHDDIEDGDAFRYGQETLHRRHGVGPAINIGDYLVGWGYRLLARDRQAVGAVVAADLLARFSDAHVKLAEGQGAELLWRQSADKALKPIDALRIYALKTAPAFEAALGAGIRLAGDHPELDKTVTEFGKNLGIAFQILNDLKDFEADSDNKIIAGQDVLASRPTVLLALALEALPPARREELLALVSGTDAVDAERVSRVRYLYELAGVFEKAERLVDKFRAKAEDLADAATPPDLRDLLLYLVDSVLDGSSHVVPEAPAESSGGLVSLPVA
ncbi:MAG: polyprenyl synthetase family protein [Planctomycetes bacterium]|nr:polyprenyl synthetase family protein [Planctomycetota bacterium]